MNNHKIKYFYQNFLIAVSCVFLIILSACNNGNFEDNSQLALVNIKNFDRAQLGYLVDKVCKSNPKVVVLDFRLSELKDPLTDSIFRKSIEDGNVKFVFTTSIKGIFLTKGTEEFTGNLKRSTNSFFKVGEYLEGHTDTFSENKQDKPVMTTYPLSIHLKDEISQHASVLTAFYIDSLVTQKYISYHKNYEADLNLSKARTNLYQTVDVPFEKIDSYTWKKLSNKIVIMGYIGPTYEDKKYTYLNENDFETPDTYGPFIVAEIISNILNIH